MPEMRHRLSVHAFALALALTAPACLDGEIVPTDAERAAAAAAMPPTTMAAPPRAGFEAVADALVATCGTLDCHGQTGRNLRLFGGHGLRLAKSDDPGGRATTAAEYQASYWSTIGLEPELLDEVVRDGGKQPDRLMIVRKARGEVKHKGGTLMQANDQLDRCLQLWLAGHPDSDICDNARPQRPGAN
jgi:hypothetical protein